MARILVIDDDEIVNTMIVQMLSEQGHKADAAWNGNQGLKLMETIPYDLVVTDIIMPEKEGIETINIIRQKSRTLPIIAISGGGKIGSQQYLSLAHQFGADYIFHKPFRKEPFLDAVRECLVV
jgi:DNA-binding response OmpR family regulator